MIFVFVAVKAFTLLLADLAAGFFLQNHSTFYLAIALHSSRFPANESYLSPFNNHSAVSSKIISTEESSY
ncbi:hypothetical protein Y032_0043g806 [Ancylostoma ceylanicum]|uniref:Uncharacterized protein n=1 Tax=Ancylostoma ceylanicum TaxID=53326 RepID=A0A016UG86_9BILA|nr:hypothetical protein Y032_0043g806 [Ancylostoma ceylanicum]